ncbi:MAG: hypothetical protein HRT67_05095 [Flavobacteriaceae bacterium]|nr:hypothetical protein [Flavobacteriaceae bacterium]
MHLIIVLENLKPLRSYLPLTQNLILEYLKKPLLVYKYLFKTNPTTYFWQLLIIAGAINGLEKGLNRITTFDGNAITIIVIAVLLGFTLGWLSYFISAGILHLFGAAFLGGKATAKDFRVVIA